MVPSGAGAGAGGGLRGGRGRRHGGGRGRGHGKFAVVRINLRPHFLEGEKMRIEAAAANHVAARRRKHNLPETADNRRDKQNRGANCFPCAAIDARRVKVAGVNQQRIRLGNCHIRAHLDENFAHVQHVENLGNPL